MTDSPDIRWQQRFQNYKKALARLGDGVELACERELSALESQGLIQAFEFVYAMAWRTIKDFYENQGAENMQGSRDAFRTAFSRGLVKNGETWMEMIESCRQSAHAYDESIAKSITAKIINPYFAEFAQLKTALEKQI